MVKKLDKSGDEPDSVERKSPAQLADTVKESAQQIWLAGLGAFAKAQEEGGRVFEALVKDGVTMQRKTQSAAGDKFTEATSRMATMATELTSKATGQWDKLEGIFEDRVARALRKLGVPTAQDVAVLVARIDELERMVTHPDGGAAPRGVRKVAAKVARKRVPARKST